jgi:hypothetical protein
MTSSRSESDHALRTLLAELAENPLPGARYAYSVVEREWPAIVALAAAEAAPLDDCDERMKAYRARRENLARRKYNEGREQGLRDSAEAAPLDVERLARALFAAGLREDSAHAAHWSTLAAWIAREYAALRSPDTEMAEPHDWRDHSSSPHHHDDDDPEPIWDHPDTETAGEAG